MCIPRFCGKSGEFPLQLNYVRRTAIAHEETLGIFSSWLFNIIEWQRAIFAGFRPAADGHTEVLAEPCNEPVNNHIATTTFRMFSQYIKTFPITTTATSLGFASNATKSSEQSKNKPRTNRKHYCWTHGSCNHSSDRCKFPIEGHQMDATFYNRKNGSNTGCPKHNN
jgi:hypothetical protein